MPATLNAKEEEKRRRMRLSAYASELHQLQSIPKGKLTGGQEMRINQLKILLDKKK